MENRDTSELGANDELLGMISGHFENQSRTWRRETAELPQLLVREDDEDDEDDELPEHRFVVQEGSGKITLFVGDNIFRRRYVRGDLVTFTCTGCEKISRKTPGVW